MQALTLLLHAHLATHTCADAMFACRMFENFVLQHAIRTPVQALRVYCSTHVSALMCVAATMADMSGCYADAGGCVAANDSQNSPHVPRSCLRHLLHSQHPHMGPWQQWSRSLQHLVRAMLPVVWSVGATGVHRVVLWL
jgi:hypothetical protein